jgi:hypothetical protein
MDHEDRPLSDIRVSPEEQEDTVPLTEFDGDGSQSSARKYLSYTYCDWSICCVGLDVCSPFMDCMSNVLSFVSMCLDAF